MGSSSAWNAEPGSYAPSTLRRYTESEFAAEIDALVADGAPRLFALVQEAGTREDAWVVAWGLASHGGAQVVTVNGCTLLRCRSAERARDLMARGHGNVRLVWHDEAGRRPRP